MRAVPEHLSARGERSRVGSRELNWMKRVFFRFAGAGVEWGAVVLMAGGERGGTDDVESRG